MKTSHRGGPYEERKGPGGSATTIITYYNLLFMKKYLSKNYKLIQTKNY